ncbi:MAG: hypothetical protein CME70_06515 [Halobacteriovorax sp.]|nr:hypothetical protein [Halobacteriovorax sp.]
MFASASMACESEFDFLQASSIDKKVQICETGNPWGYSVLVDGKRRRSFPVTSSDEVDIEKELLLEMEKYDFDEEAIQKIRKVVKRNIEYEQERLSKTLTIQSLGLLNNLNDEEIVGELGIKCPLGLDLSITADDVKKEKRKSVINLNCRVLKPRLEVIRDRKKKEKLAARLEQFFGEANSSALRLENKVNSKNTDELRKSSITTVQGFSLTGQSAVDGYEVEADCHREVERPKSITDSYTINPERIKQFTNYEIPMVMDIGSPELSSSSGLFDLTHDPRTGKPTDDRGFRQDDENLDYDLSVGYVFRRNVTRGSNLIISPSVSVPLIREREGVMDVVTDPTRDLNFTKPSFILKIGITF